MALISGNEDHLGGPFLLQQTIIIAKNTMEISKTKQKNVKQSIIPQQDIY